MSEVKKLIEKLEKVEKQVIKSGQTSQADEERGKVLDSFLKEFEQNRKGSLIDVLEKLSGLLPSKVYARKEQTVSTEEKITSHINRFMRNRIGDLIGEALKTTNPQQLPALATFVENQVLMSDATPFNVSDTIQVDGLISVMQMLVQFYKSGVQINGVLNFVNNYVWPRFEELPEDRKLDFLRALAEISLFTRAPVSDDTLRSMVKILKVYMPTSKGSVFEEEKSSTHVECLLYVFHHLAHKAKNPKTATSLCVELRERLKNVTLMTAKNRGATH